MVGPPGNRVEVCKYRFAKLFDRGETFIDERIAEVKAGIEKDAPPLNDSTKVSLDVNYNLN